MLKHLVFLVIFLAVSTRVIAQEDTKFIDLSKTTKFIDTLLIDRDLNNWSIRALGSFKQQQFKISSNNNKYTYLPNNPYGVGIGIGTKKAIFDFSFNIKANEENPTERYDIVWSFFKQNHLFDFFFQHYKGFNVEVGNNGQNLFREDIKSLSTAVRYMYMFHEAEYSIAAMKTGLITADKSTFSLGLGGFLMYSNQDANGAIIPYQNAGEDRIEEFHGTGAGVMVAFSTLIVLPHNFFLSLNVTPGIGLMSKYVTTEETGYQPSNPIINQIGMSMILGYNAKQYYINLAMTNGYYSTDFNYGDQVSFGYLNAKLAFGYKLKGKIKRNWKK